LYIGEPETGLLKLAGDAFEEVPGGRRFTDEGRLVILPYDEGRILIGTRADGLFLADGTAMTRFPTEIDEWLRTKDLYRGGVLPDGTIALTSTGGGMTIIDRQGRFLHRFDSSSEVDDAVYSVFADRQGALWLGMESGIARVETPSPVSIFTRAAGLAGGGVNSVRRHAGTLYVASSRGVYVLKTPGTAAGLGVPRQANASFAPVAGISLTVQSWWLESIDDPSGRGPSQLLAATGDGVYRIEGDKAVLVLESVTGSLQPAVLYRSRRNPGRVFVGLFDGLASLRLDRGKWVFEGRVQGVGDEVRSMVEDADGRLWLGTTTGGIVRIDFWSADPSGGGASLPLNPRIDRFGVAHGLPQTAVNVAWAGGRPHFLATADIFRFDSGAGRFVPDATFKLVGVDADGAGTDGVLREDARGDVWLNFGRESGVARRRIVRGGDEAVLALFGVPDLAHLSRGRRRGLVRRPRWPDPLRSRPPQGAGGRLLGAHPARRRQRRPGAARRRLRGGRHAP
jgi:hypothetical protein